MTKQITITISDYVWDTYLSEVTENRSAFIEGLIQKGSDVDGQAIGSLKQNNTKLLQELQSKNEEIKKLKFTIVALQNNIDKMKRDDKPEAEFLKNLRLVRDKLSCAVCYKSISPNDVIKEVPDGLIHDKCYLKVDSFIRERWRNGETKNNFSLIND